MHQKNAPMPQISRISPVIIDSKLISFIQFFVNDYLNNTYFFTNDKNKV